MAELGTLVKQIQVMKNHYRAFEKAEEIISAVQALEGQANEAKKQKESILGDIKRLEDARIAAEDNKKLAELAAAERLQALETEYNAERAAIKVELEKTSDDVRSKIQAINDRLMAAEAAHAERITEMREEIESISKTLQSARIKASKLKKQVSGLLADEEV